MGSLGDDEGDSKDGSLGSDSTVDLYDDADTQIFDSQFSPSTFHGDEFNGEDVDEIQLLQSTQQYYDTFRLDDGCETQLVNFGCDTQLGCETQMLNLGGETQSMHLGGETQVVNIGDESQASDILDSFDNIDTQLFVDNDTEVALDTDTESDTTKVIDDTEAMLDDNSRKHKAESDAPSSEQHKTEADAPSSEQRRTGPKHRCFTSIRTASVRASGLAARNMAAAKDSISNSCSSLSGGSYIKKRDAEHNTLPFKGESWKYLEEVNNDCTPEEYEQMQGHRNENMVKVGLPTARKLFSEDAPTENKELHDFPPLSHCGNDLAGLSYVDSQEPGELSQANALNFVDKFLKVSLTDFDQEADIGKSSRCKSVPVSCAKGIQSVAKSATLISTTGERGIFDWDDNCEDEGGGEFYMKKKEFFSDIRGQKRKSFTQSQKTRRAYSKSERVVDASGQKEKHLGIHDRQNGIVCSDSRMKLVDNKQKDASTNSAETPVQEANLRKNLLKELNEQANLGSRDGILENSTDKDIPEMQDIRFDTQMAAEAMETLYFGESGSCRTELDTSNARRDSNDKSKRCKGQKNNEQKCHSKKTSQLKRMAKLNKDPAVESPKRSSRVRKQCEQEPVDKCKRLRTDAKEHITSNGNKKSKNALCKVVKKKRDEETSRKQHINGIDKCSPTASRGGMSVKEQSVQEKFSTYTPVACRTRRSVKASKPESKNDTSMNLSEEMNCLTGFPKRRRTSQRLSSIGLEINGQSMTRLTRSKAAVASSNLDTSVQRKLRSLACADPVSLSLGQQPGDKLVQTDVHKGISKEICVDDVSGLRYRNTAEREVVIGLSSICDGLQTSKRKQVNANVQGSPKERHKPSSTTCTTPVSYIRPVKESSPICMGDEYLKQSWRRSSSQTSILREMGSFAPTVPETVSPGKDLRRRRDMSAVRVLFSRHLDEDIIKQQKKILSRLGASVASSMSDATHFIADEFIRTKNMLEAIAFGKPIVTHLWLESCGQACCLIDEKKYILRDAKKEKEFGFNLPASLAHACQHPLLQGQRVLITPSTKPGKEILSSLVKAVHGLAFERIGRTALKDNKLPDNLLVLSCEEDYAECVPFLEKGAPVYSSELLLNGIVIQRLEYERHRLFTDRFKTTRSTVWLRKDTNQYFPVSKCK